MPEQMDEQPHERLARSARVAIRQLGEQYPSRTTINQFSFDFADVIVASGFTACPGYTMEAVRTTLHTFGSDPWGPDRGDWGVVAMAPVPGSYMRVSAVCRLNSLHIVVADEVDPRQTNGRPGRLVSRAEHMPFGEHWYKMHTGGTAGPRLMDAIRAREYLADCIKMAVDADFDQLLEL